MSNHVASPVPTSFRGKPVPELDISFEWQGGTWLEIFDQHTLFIQQDLLRALAADRVVVYLSCPVTSRGGSFATTNVDIATATAHRLVGQWGDRFWFLNPAQYQLESNHGVGLIRRHAAALGLSNDAIDALLANKATQPSGGDYMRMWTRVLAEDESGENLGGRFSAYYFIGPADYRHFFTDGGKVSLSDGIEAYFSRKYVLDQEFHAHFTPPFDNVDPNDPVAQKGEWDRRRKEFLRYYATRASAAFSRGSRDEWNIWVSLNQRRLTHPKLGVGTQIAGYFDGQQVDPASADSFTTPGYALPTPVAEARVDAILRRTPPGGSDPDDATSHDRAARRLGRGANKTASQ